jgi:hypothetical protein
MVVTVGAEVRALFLGSRAHFQKWKYPHFQMKNSNKIEGKSKENSSGW